MAGSIEKLYLHVEQVAAAVRAFEAALLKSKCTGKGIAFDDGFHRIKGQKFKIHTTSLDERELGSVNISIEIDKLYLSHCIWFPGWNTIRKRYFYDFGHSIFANFRRLHCDGSIFFSGRLDRWFWRCCWAGIVRITEVASCQTK